MAYNFSRLGELCYHYRWRERGKGWEGWNVWIYIRIFMYDDKHKKSLKNKWFLCIFIVDFYDLVGTVAKAKSISCLLCCFLVGNAGSKICCSSRRIINFYCACQFLLFDFYYSSTQPPTSREPRARKDETFLICLMYICCLAFAGCCWND